MPVQKLAAPVRAQYFDDLPLDAPAPPGAFTFFSQHGDDAETPAGLVYVCPCGCGDRGSLAFRPYASAEDIAARRTWDWDGNREAPTLTPSVNHVDHWHGDLRAGIWSDA